MQLSLEDFCELRFLTQTMALSTSLVERSKICLILWLFDNSLSILLYNLYSIFHISYFILILIILGGDMVMQI